MTIENGRQVDLEENPFYALPLLAFYNVNVFQEKKQNVRSNICFEWLSNKCFDQI